MKILKLIQNNHGSYYTVFDKVDDMTYEKVGSDYVGSFVDDEGSVLQSHFLKRESFGNAFGGREITLKMKDGSLEVIKNRWFDCGSYPEHGKFVSIGAGTVKDLKDCYVYYGTNINKEAFGKMIEEYLKKDRIYEYNEVKDWVNSL